jgi:hypothetical protein
MLSAVYRIKKIDEGWTVGWPIGKRVRLISGIDGNATPGYHFTKGFVTVCSADAKEAQFIGIRWKNLREAKD